MMHGLDKVARNHEDQEAGYATATLSLNLVSDVPIAHADGTRFYAWKNLRRAIRKMPFEENPDFRVLGIEVSKVWQSNLHRRKW